MKINKLIIQYIASLLLIASSLYCISSALQFKIYGAIFITIPSVIMLLIAILNLVSIFQIWTRAYFSNLAIVMLIISTAYFTQDLLRYTYQYYVLRDLSIPTSKNENSFELKNTGHTKNNDVILNLGYALSKEFNNITIGKYNYQLIENDIYQKILADPTKIPRFLITEEAKNPEKIDNTQWPQRGDVKITIYDRKHSKEIGIWNGPGHGWPGPQAVNFIKKTLYPNPLKRNPESSQKKASNVKYRELATKTKLTIDDFKKEYKIRGCGNNVELIPNSQNSTYNEIRVVQFIFGTINPEEIICTPEGIFIFRSTSTENISVAWLTPDGKFKIQYITAVERTSMAENSRRSYVSNITTNNGNLIIIKNFFNTLNKSATQADKTFEITIPF